MPPRARTTSTAICAALGAWLGATGCYDQAEPACLGSLDPRGCGGIEGADGGLPDARPPDDPAPDAGLDAGDDPQPRPDHCRWEAETIQEQAFDEVEGHRLWGVTLAEGDLVYAVSFGEGAEALAELRHAYRILDGGWAIDVIDTQPGIGGAAALVTPEGERVVAYVAQTARQGDGGNELRLARWNLDSWDIEVIEPALATLVPGSMALDGDGRVNIVYQDAAGDTTDLRWAVEGVAAWSIVAFASWPEPFVPVTPPTIARDPTGGLHVLFGIDGELTLASRTGAEDNTSYLYEVVATAMDGRPSSVAFDANGAWHAAFVDPDDQLAWASNASGQVAVEIVDEGPVATQSMRVVPTERGVRIAYTDATMNHLSVATRTGDGAWAIEDLEQWACPTAPDLAFDASGTLQLGYGVFCQMDNVAWRLRLARLVCE